PRARAETRPAVPARFWRLRGPDADLLRVARARSRLAPAPVLRAATAAREMAVRRLRAHGRAPALVVARNAALVGQAALRRGEAPFRRSPAARVLPLGAPPRALLPLRLGDADALVRRRADLPALSGSAALGRRPGAAGAHGHADRRRTLVGRAEQRLHLQHHPDEPVCGDP